MSLCWKCRKNWQVIFSWNHCYHDEPEEKPKCWCELSNHSASVQGYDGDQPMRYFKRFYCPVCGKKLKEEKPKCWWCEDWLAFTKESKGFPIYEVVKKLIGLNAENPECPICGRKHKEAI